MSVEVPTAQHMMVDPRGPLKRKREEEAWTPYMCKRGGLAADSAQFLARTTALFRDLQREMAAKVLEARHKEALQRAESLRIAQLHPVHVSEPSAQGEPAEAPLEVTPVLNPTSPGEAVEPMKAEKKASQGRETPSMGPVKAGSIVDDMPATSAFSRSLNFVVGSGHEGENSSAQKSPVFLALTPSAVV